MNKPVLSHGPGEGSLFTARQPATIAAVQNKTSSGSMVIRIDPAAASGAACNASVRKNAVRPLVWAPINLSTSTLTIAAITGEKNRTPNSVSPHNLVPRNCVYAIRGGLL